MLINKIETATNKLIFDEMSELYEISELPGYIALDPHILDVIYIEILLREKVSV